MMVPAVPAYIDDNQFADAPPGHKYSLYLKYWKQSSWEMSIKEKRQAMEGVVSLPDMGTQMKEIRKRLSCLTGSLPVKNHFTIYGCSSAPFVTGMGIDHPMENGFAFLNPYGLPYLPGSSIKGVLRRAARQLCTMEECRWHGNEGWIAELFGDKECRGALIFWDCVPKLKGASPKMELDIMNPHYGGYYQGEETPHDAGSPVPIVFLTVPADSEFVFNVSITPEKLRSEGLLGGDWKAIMAEAFCFAFEWVGFGAKTAIGYGAMIIKRDTRDQVIKEQKKPATTEPQRKLEELTKLYEKEKDRGSLRRQGPAAQSLANLLGIASDWPEKEDRHTLADLAEEFHEEAGWPKGPKGIKRKEKIKNLRSI